MDVSLKGTACIIFDVITGDSTIINKGRTGEFASEIIVGEVQESCRMKK
jgi:hypothetical protein